MSESFSSSKRSLSPEAPLKSVPDLLKKIKEGFSYDELKDPQNLPIGVDPFKLELYLHPEDFPVAFKHSIEEFKKFPAWRKNELKRQANLLQ